MRSPPSCGTRADPVSTDPLYAPATCVSCGEPLSDRRRRKPFLLNEATGERLHVWACSFACVDAYIVRLDLHPQR